MIKKIKVVWKASYFPFSLDFWNVYLNFANLFDDLYGFIAILKSSLKFLHGVCLSLWIWIFLKFNLFHICILLEYDSCAKMQSIRKVKSGDKGLGCILAHTMDLGETFQVLYSLWRLYYVDIIEEWILFCWNYMWQINVFSVKLPLLKYTLHNFLFSFVHFFKNYRYCLFAISDHDNLLFSVLNI